MSDTGLETPLRALRALVKQVDSKAVSDTPLGQPISRFEFISAMVRLCEMHMVQVNLAAALKTDDREAAQQHVDTLTREIGELLQLALSASKIDPASGDGEGQA